MIQRDGVQSVIEAGSGRSVMELIRDHGPPESAGTREPDPNSLMFIISQAEGGEQGPGKLGAIVIHSTEILGTQDAGALGKAGDAATSRR